LIRVKLRIRPGFAEVELHHRIDAIESAVLVAEAARLEVFAVQAMLIVPAAGAAQAADQVGHGVAVLAHGEARQLQPRGLSRSRAALE